jgi:arylsulfatase A-like enzyme
MIQALYENGVLDNTAIVFTADHGEMLYDHNHVAKGYPFDSSARLPFILRLPTPHEIHRGGRMGAPVNRVNQVIELRDLLPTFCELAGVEVPDHVDGRSILPLTRGESAGWREYLHGEHFLGEDSNHWLVDGHEKYVWYSQSGRELLFDLDGDPTEMHDLSAERPERVRFWRERLIGELDGREEGFIQVGQLTAGRPQGPTLSGAGRYAPR